MNLLQNIFSGLVIYLHTFFTSGHPIVLNGEDQSKICLYNWAQPPTALVFTKDNFTIYVTGRNFTQMFNEIHREMKEHELLYGKPK